MLKNILVLLSILLSTCLSACTSTSPAQATVTFVGNSGFLVTLGDKKILIDGITYGIPLPLEVKESLHNSKPPFDNVDLILATHDDPDHFYAAGLSDFMQDNVETLFISTPWAVDQLLATDPTLVQRVIAIPLEAGESQEQNVNGIRVVAYAVSHGINESGMPLPNLGLLVEANGVKFFHSGDLGPDVITAEYFSDLGLPGEKIDIAVLPYFVFSTPDLLPLAVEGVAAVYFIPGHFDMPVPIEDANAVLRAYPDAILFDKALDSWLMPEAKPK
jgi:L-ascorbate metabolism protein UlaG (beta-lactamase superfamily)